MASNTLDRIASALEKMVPKSLEQCDFRESEVFIWSANPDLLTPVKKIESIDLSLLVGVDAAKETLLQNTFQFTKGFSANNVLLWGARGMGKSSLVKAVHQTVIARGLSLKLIELQREDLSSISRLLSILALSDHRFLLFCDDLSFGYDDQTYKSLKTVLDGGVRGTSENVLFYATSNRRHLMPRDMIENEKSSAINPSETVEEKLSLSDRFGLWIGFHPCSQEEYLSMIYGYCEAYGVDCDPVMIDPKAIEWQVTRGARSGRVAWQFFLDYAGKSGIQLKEVKSYSQDILS